MKSYLQNLYIYEWYVCILHVKCILWYLLLWHVVPLYPGAHSQVPSSGEQEAPFLQLHRREQLGPQRPSAHTLSQWIPGKTYKYTWMQGTRNTVPYCDCSKQLYIILHLLYNCCINHFGHCFIVNTYNFNNVANTVHNSKSTLTVCNVNIYFLHVHFIHSLCVYVIFLFFYLFF